jgi:hypothetical protein
MTQEESIILKRLRHMKPRRNEKYRAWLKSKYPKGYHFCHLIGSASRSLKLNDLLATCKPAEEHLYIDHMGKGNFTEDFKRAMFNLTWYAVNELEISWSPDAHSIDERFFSVLDEYFDEIEKMQNK